MVAAITTAIGDVIGWIGEVVTALTTQTGGLYALLPLFCVGIAISAILVGVKLIRSLVWGA